MQSILGTAIQGSQSTESLSKDDASILEKLGLNTTTLPSQSTNTLFPPLSVPGSSLDVDIVNQKLSKIQSSIDDGFAQVISKISALNLSKGGNRKTKRRRRVNKSRQYKKYSLK
jgi:hypothetical protein